MIIKIKVKTKSQFNKVEKVDDKEWAYLVYTSKLPIKGDANKNVLKLLSQYFNINQSQIKIKSGEKSKIKIIDIDSN